MIPLLVKIDCIETSNFCSKHLALLGSHGASNDRIFAIEVLGNLFKRRVSSFDVKEVDDEELHCQPRTVDNVVFPATGQPLLLEVIPRPRAYQSIFFNAIGLTYWLKKSATKIHHVSHITWCKASMVFAHCPPSGTSESSLWL